MLDTRYISWEYVYRQINTYYFYGKRGNMNAVVAERGQVTIPKQFRDRLGIGPHTVVVFEQDGSHLILKKVIDEDAVSRVLGCVHTTRDTDTILRELRGEP